jgi:hypothetical protein
MISGDRIFGSTIMIVVVLVLAATKNGAQTTSPQTTVKERVDGVSLTITYRRPMMNGRMIFGPRGIVPSGSIWRTGEDEATTFTTDSPLGFASARGNNRRLPAGTYSLFTRPRETNWEIMFNRQTGQWGSQYDARRNALTVTAPVARAPVPPEQFTIFIDDFKTNRDGGELRLEWEHVVVRVPFTPLK